jgi:hypothetical protein
LFDTDTRRYSGGRGYLKSELEVTEENLRAYSDKDEHIEETMLYVHDQLGKKAPTANDLRNFLENHPKLLSLQTYQTRYSDKFNAMFEKHGKEVNGSGSENDPIPLSDQDENLLWGMMLGDGCYPPGRGENGNPCIEYGSIDRPQLTVLKERTDANIWKDNTDFTAGGENSKDHYRIRSKCLPNLEKFRKPYRTVLNESADPNAFWTTWDGITGETFDYLTWEMMYMSKRMKSKKARIPEDVEISPELMMTWHLGDGSFCEQNGTSRITAEFPEEDYRRIQSQLEEEVFDGLDHPEDASTVNPQKGKWSLTPLNPNYLQPGAQLGYTDHEEQRIIDEAQNGELQRDVGKPLRPDMIIDRKYLQINKPGVEAFFDYLPDHDDWDNVMPRKFPD